MIYTVSVCDLAAAKLACDSFYATGRVYGSWNKESHNRSYQPGRMVFETFEDAAAAAIVLDESYCREHGRKVLSTSQKWIVLGVDADWEKDTGLHVFKTFPKARDLLRQCPLIEIEQRLPETVPIAETQNPC